MRHDFDFYARAFGQSSDLNGGTRGEILREILRIDFVHPGKVREVSEEHGGLHHVSEGELLVIKDGLHVFEHALGLGFDVASDEIAIGGADGDLTSAEQQVADAHGMVVWADGRG